jgi:hypothetical protein
LSYNGSLNRTAGLPSLSLYAPSGILLDYKSLVKALEEHFAPPNQAELYRVQLTERRQKPAESLPELGQVIRRLVACPRKATARYNPFSFSDH